MTYRLNFARLAKIYAVVGVVLYGITVGAW